MKQVLKARFQPRERLPVHRILPVPSSSPESRSTSVRTCTLWGAMLWEMLIGHAVFKGSPAEVMYQHLHAPYRSNNSKLSHSRSLFYFKCCWRKTRPGVFRAPSNFLRQCQR